MQQIELKKNHEGGYVERTSLLNFSPKYSRLKKKSVYLRKKKRFWKRAGNEFLFKDLGFKQWRLRTYRPGFPKPMYYIRVRVKVQPNWLLVRKNVTRSNIHVLAGFRGKKPAYLIQYRAKKVRRLKKVVNRLIKARERLSRSWKKGLFGLWKVLKKRKKSPRLFLPRKVAALVAFNKQVRLLQNSASLSLKKKKGQSIHAVVQNKDIRNFQIGAVALKNLTQPQSSFYTQEQLLLKQVNRLNATQLMILNRVRSSDVFKKWPIMDPLHITTQVYNAYLESLAANSEASQILPIVRTNNVRAVAYRHVILHYLKVFKQYFFKKEFSHFFKVLPLLGGAKLFYKFFKAGPVLAPWRMVQYHRSVQVGLQVYHRDIYPRRRKAIFKLQIFMKRIMFWLYRLKNIHHKWGTVGRNTMIPTIGGSQHIFYKKKIKYIY